MLSLLAVLAVGHGIALAGVLWAARHDVVLVDEQGHRLAPSTAWQERVVPAHAPSRARR